VSDTRHRIKRFLSELRRRRVVQVAAAYAAVGWVVIEVSTTIVPELDLADWIPRAVILLVLLGFPVSLVLSWVFDVTPRGVRRTESLVSGTPGEIGAKDPTRRRVARTHRSRALPYATVAILMVAVGIGSFTFLRGGSARQSASAAEPRFLAVLPFGNTSPNADNEYFADGVTDDVLTHLSQVPDFAVISRTTTMAYKATDKTAPEIAEELGVQYVLAGTVRRAGQEVRISAELVDGRTDQRIWAKTYDRQLEDIFAVQTEIAQSIVEALEVELSGGVAARIERPPTANTEAYDLFLLGRESLHRYDVEGNERAIAFFGQALELDPEFTLARAWLSLALAHHELLFGMGRAWADSAAAEARLAVAEQPDLADAHGALGDAHLAVGRYAEAASAYERALELNPSDWHAAVSLGAAHQGQNRWDEAIRLVRRSLTLDPVRSHIAYANLTLYYATLGLFARAQSTIERAIAVQPDDANVIYARGYLDLLRGRREAALESAERLAGRGIESSVAAVLAAQLLVWSGEVERARVAAEAAYTRSPTASRAYITGVLFAYTLERTGESARARTVLAEMERYALEQIEAGGAGTSHFHHSFFYHALAVIHGLRGERDEAFHWLEEAVRSGWNHAAVLPSADPLLDGLQGDTRFQSALDRMERDIASMRARVEREGL
jgi:protein kinase/serine/threonine-protein kinase